MAKTRKITVTFPDQTQATRETARVYTHAVKCQITNNISWCGRPDLMEKTLKTFSWPMVGILTSDPWIEHPINAPEGFKPYCNTPQDVARNNELCESWKKMGVDN